MFPSRPGTALPLSASSLDKLWFSDAELVNEILAGANPSRLRMVTSTPAWFTEAYNNMMMNDTQSSEGSSRRGDITVSSQAAGASGASMSRRGRGESVYLPSLMSSPASRQSQIYKMRARQLRNLCSTTTIDTAIATSGAGGLRASGSSKQSPMSLLEEHARGGRLFELDYSDIQCLVRAHDGPSDKNAANVRSRAAASSSSSSSSTTSSEVAMTGRRKTGRMSSMPRALFYVTEVAEGSLRYLPQLVPLCIQCGDGADIILPGMGHQGRDEKEEVDSDSASAFTHVAMGNMRQADATSVSAVEGGWGWARAKAHLMSAHALAHLYASLYLNCIARVEPFAIAMHRCLHHSHPAHVLLLPYLKYAVSTAVTARQYWCGDSSIASESLTSSSSSSGGTIARYVFGIGKDELVALKKQKKTELLLNRRRIQPNVSNAPTSTTTSVNNVSNANVAGSIVSHLTTGVILASLSPAARFEANGMLGGGVYSSWDDAEARSDNAVDVLAHGASSTPSAATSASETVHNMIPSYPFREDSLLLWCAILDYTDAFVRAYYASDDDVTADDELQSFWKETCVHGYGTTPRDVDRKCPLRSRKEVSCLLAGLIHTSTVDFTAFTKQAWRTYSNPLLCPLATRQQAGPIKTEDAMRAQERHFVEAMADAGTSLVGAAFMQLLSTEQGLGQPMMSPTWSKQEEEAIAGAAAQRKQAMKLRNRNHRGRNQRRTGTDAPAAAATAATAGASGRSSSAAFSTADRITATIDDSDCVFSADAWVTSMKLHRGFLNALEICEEVIRERNTLRPMPYDVLLPSNLLRGMAM